MNKTKIEWADYTWNPVTGCKHGCTYCYARIVANQKVNHPNPAIAHKYRNNFEPTFHPQEFEKNKTPSSVKKGKKVFVGSMCDLFGDWVPYDWIKKILIACTARQHTYFFLTKNPDRYYHLVTTDDDNLPMLEEHFNWWFGFSATNQKQYDKNNGDMTVGIINEFVSLEPLYGPIKLSKMHQKWLIVGSETKNGKSINLPKAQWILDIRKQCAQLKIPLFEKNSLLPLNLPGGLIQQWPEIKSRQCSEAKQSGNGRVQGQ